MTWEEFEEEIARRGRVDFWWRDDDAGAVVPALKRTLSISLEHEIPLALAVVPEAAEPELFGLLHDHVSVLQHGTDHRNRAAPGEKKTEYPAAEPLEAALARVSDGFGRLRMFAGERFFPALAPPWNRVREDMLQKLPAIGIRGVTTYGARRRPDPAHGLAQVNTHVDVIAWRRGRHFIGESQALELALKRLGEEPLGWLTHHAVQDADTFRFLERLFQVRAIRWLSAPQVFSYTGFRHG